MDEATPRKQSASLTGRRVWLGSGCQSCWPWSGAERREGHRKDGRGTGHEQREWQRDRGWVQS